MSCVFVLWGQQSTRLSNVVVDGDIAVPLLAVHNRYDTLSSCSSFGVHMKDTVILQWCCMYERVWSCSRAWWLPSIFFFLPFRFRRVQGTVLRFSFLFFKFSNKTAKGGLPVSKSSTQPWVGYSSIFSTICDCSNSEDFIWVVTKQLRSVERALSSTCFLLVYVYVCAFLLWRRLPPWTRVRTARRRLTCVEARRSRSWNVLTQDQLPSVASSPDPMCFSECFSAGGGRERRGNHVNVYHRTKHRIQLPQALCTSQSTCRSW